MTIGTVIEKKQITPIKETELGNPHVIEFTISKVDLEHAKEYTSCDQCLVATALRNRGFNVFALGQDEVFLDGGDRYKPTERLNSDELKWDSLNKRYDKSIIGKQVKLVRTHLKGVPI